MPGAKETAQFFHAAQGFALGSSRGKNLAPVSFLKVGSLPFALLSTMSSGPHLAVTFLRAVE